MKLIPVIPVGTGGKVGPTRSGDILTHYPKEVSFLKRCEGQ
ncbi:hypothetical protein [Bacillus paramycoides]|nr:hypothetical protein [Bacillus paramycoides]MED0987690.1 hypothetical protein [Bacillus paramycoides]MED1104227.1 hypothetical protein [Bacillus paramycoides]